MVLSRVVESRRLCLTLIRRCNVTVCFEMDGWSQLLNLMYPMWCPVNMFVEMSEARVALDLNRDFSCTAYTLVNHSVVSARLSLLWGITDRWLTAQKLSQTYYHGLITFLEHRTTNSQHRCLFFFFFYAFVYLLL